MEGAKGREYVMNVRNVVIQQFNVVITYTLFLTIRPLHNTVFKQTKNNMYNFIFAESPCLEYVQNL